MKLNSLLVKGIVWTSVLNVFSLINSFGYKFLLGIYLSSSDFSKFAVIQLLFGFTTILFDFGFSIQIVKRISMDSRYLNNVFFIRLVMITLTSIILFFSSHLIEKFYNYSDLKLIIKVSIIYFLFSGLRLTFFDILRRDLDFKTITMVNTLQMVSNLIFTFLLIGSYGVLGCIYSLVLSYFISFISIFFLKSNIKIGISLRELNVKYMIELIVDIKYYLFKDISTIFFSKIDEIVVGRVLGEDILGYYYFGKSLIYKVIQTLNRSFSGVFFPYFSKLKENYFSKYKMITSVMYIVATPIFVGIVIISEPLFHLLFGIKWDDSLLVFNLFAISGVFLTATANLAVPALLVHGKEKIIFYVDLIVSLLFSFFLIMFGKSVISITILGVFYIAFKSLLWQFLLMQYNKYNKLKYFIEVLLLLLPGASMLIIKKMFDISVSQNLPELLLQILGFGIIVVILTLILHRDLLKRIIDIKGKLK